MLDKSTAVKMVAQTALRGSHPRPPKTVNRTLWLREAKLSLKLALPLVGAQLAQIAIGTTDVLMMGWLGPQPLAAGALANNLLFPIILFGLGLISATAPLFAQSLGARRFREIRPALQQGLWVGLILGALGGFVLWHGGTLLLWLGQSPNHAALAQSYLHYALWGLLPAFWLVALRGFLAAHGRPRALFVVMTFGVLLNALGNYALMFGHFGFPALGLVGAGITTALVNSFMFLALALFVLRDRRFRRYRLWFGAWILRLHLLLEIHRIGLPIAFSILAETTLFASAAFLMGLVGTVELAGHAIALQCLAIAFMVPLGFSQAATVRVGFAAGAGDRAGVIRSGWVALGAGALFAVVPVFCFTVLPMTLGDLFLDLSLPESLPVLAMVVTLLHIAALFQIFDGVMVIAAGALRGLKDTKIPMWLSLLGFWVVGFGSSVGLGFGLKLGGVGIWSGLALGVGTVALLLVWRFHVLSQRFEGAR